MRPSGLTATNDAVAMPSPAAHVAPPVSPTQLTSVPIAPVAASRAKALTVPSSFAAALGGGVDVLAVGAQLDPVRAAQVGHERRRAAGPAGLDAVDRAGQPERVRVDRQRRMPARVGRRGAVLPPSMPAT